MKAAFSYITITIILLVLSVVCNAQNNQPATHPPVQTDPVLIIATDTLKKVNSRPSIGSTAKTDSLKITKKKNKKKELADSANPYQPSTPDGKPLPYNTYRESKKEPPKGDPQGAEILRSIFLDKRHH